MSISIKHLWYTWYKTLVAGVSLGILFFAIYCVCYVNWYYNGGLPIQTAIHQRDYATVRKILREGTPPDKLCVSGTTPITVATCEGDPYIVRLLLQYGSAPLPALYHVRDSESTRLLLTALSNAPYTRREKQEARNETLLNVVCDHNVALCKLLLQAGASPNEMSSESDETAVMAWASSPLPVSQDERLAARQTLDLLMQYGANIRLRDRVGRTAYDFVSDDQTHFYLHLLNRAAIR